MFIKDFSKEIYNCYTKSCNLIVYTKHEQCHLCRMIFTTIVYVYNVNLYQTIHILNVKIWFLIIIDMMKTSCALLIYIANKYDILVLNAIHIYVASKR